MIPHASDEESAKSANVEGSSGEPIAGRRPSRSPTDLARSALQFVRRHPVASAELAVIILAVSRLTDPWFRESVGVTLRFVGLNLLGSIRSTWALLQVDTQGTVESLVWTGATMLIAALPLLALARRLRGWERLHIVLLPALYFFWPLVGTASLALIAAVSGLSVWLIRFWWLRWTAFLPLAVMAASVPIHQFSIVLSHSALVEHCAGNDGKRPINLLAEQIKPDYLGVSQLRPGEVLLPGNGGRGSWWLRRTGSDWKIEASSQVNFAFWEGCLIGDELWLSRPSFMLAVRRDPTTGAESMRKIPLPVAAMDFGEIVCVPEQGRVLVTEALSGSGIWEVTAKTGAVRKWTQEVGGIGSMARRGLGDQFLAGAGSDLVVYSLSREEIVERVPAGVQMFGGIDVCPNDGEVALGDLAGRIRFFKLDAQGHYHFDWGIALRGPRVIAYSPDCQHIAVTSWDDESVYLVDRASRRHVATYRAGPALRGITFLGPRELAVVDACTMSDIVF